MTPNTPADAKFPPMLADACRLTVGAVFVASALLKAVSPADLARQVAFYGVAQGAAAFAIAIIVCAGEAALGVSLVQSRSRRGLNAAGFLLVAFSLLVAYGWLFLGLTDCGCFGRYLAVTPGWTLVKNGVLLALVRVAWRGPKRMSGAAECPASSPTSANGGAMLRGCAHSAADACPGIADPAPGAAATGPAAAVPASGALAMPLPSQPPSAPSRLCHLLRFLASPALAAIATALIAVASGGTGASPRTANGVLAAIRLETPRGPLDLGHDTALIALVSETCPACAETVEYLGGLAANADLPPVIAFVLGDAEAAARFRRRYAPAFAVAPLAHAPFFALVGAAPPRLLLLRAGQTLAFWDRPLPDEVTILEAMLRQ